MEQLLRSGPTASGSPGGTGGERGDLLMSIEQHCSLHNAEEEPGCH